MYFKKSTVKKGMKKTGEQWEKGKWNIGGENRKRGIYSIRTEETNEQKGKARRKGFR